MRLDADGLWTAVDSGSAAGLVFSWRPTTEIRLDRGRLQWRYGVKDLDFVRASSLLTSFLSLDDKRDGDIADWAQQHGVLGLCRHGLPVTHPLLDHSQVRESPLAFMGLCAPQGYPNICSERVEHWRETIRGFTGQLNFAVAIKRDDKDAVAATLKQVPDWVRLSWPGVTELFGRKYGPEFLLVQMVSWLAAPCLLVPYPAPGKDGLELKFLPFGNLPNLPGLYPLLVFELVAACCVNAGFVTCAGCGKTYRPPRRPRSGRRTFCLKCGTPAAQRAASRTYYHTHKDQIIERRRNKRGSAKVL